MLIAVATEKHFGRAARVLGITQPTLSHGIKQLEEQLGVQLVVRGSRFGGLTPEGHTTLLWARRIVADTRQMREEMRASRHGLAGRLRIAVIPTALTWAAKLATTFSEKHPKVQFTILSRNSGDILSMLDNLEVDAGVSYLDNEPLDRVSTVPLYEEVYVLLCDEASPFAERRSVAWGELAEAKLCLLTPDMQNRRIINANLAASNAAPQTVVESNSTVVLTATVMAGAAMSVLPRDLADFLAVGKPIRQIPLDGHQHHYRVGLVAPYREPHTPLLTALLGEAKGIASL
nr:LysR family transcriptional regulator [Acuticoccus kalidii]